MSTRTRLQALFLAAVIPLAGLLVFDGYQNWRRAADTATLAAMSEPAVAADTDATLAAAKAAFARNLAISGAAILLAGFAGWFAGWRLVERPLRSLTTTAERRAAGDTTVRFVEPGPDPELARLAAALNAMLAASAREIDQKALMMREVQHRVMNSLHLLGAILHLHARQVSNEAARRHLNDARQRVASMSMVYRHLCQNDATRTVEFAGMLRAFCEEIADAYLDNKPAAIEVAAEPVELPIEVAMNLALITHEMVTNAMKHGYDDEGGPLRIEFRRDGHFLELVVTDWGKGLPPGFSAERSASLGMIVIQSLTRQLRGRLAVESLTTGARFTVVVVGPGAPDDATAQLGPERLVA